MTINPVFSSLLITGLLLITGIFLIWKETHRKIKFLFVRILAHVFILIALAGLLLRPAYKTSLSPSVMLLTPHYDSKQADSVFVENPGLKIIQTNNTVPYRDSESLSLNALVRHSTNIKFILGQGLPEYATAFLQNNDVTFLPSNYPTGIIQIRFPERSVVNRINKIEGAIHNAKNNSILYLEGPGGKEDSVFLSSKKLFPFTLNFLPKQSGQFVYNLIIKDSTGNERSYPLPIDVQQQKSLKILFIQHYPTFETKYLKNFLAKQNQLVLRYKLSRDTYRYEFINHQQQQIRFSKEILASFDLLIVDTDALQELSSVDLNALQQAVQSGLGIFFLFNENPSKIRQLKSFLPFDFKKANSDTAQFTFDSKTISLPAWPLTLDASPFVFTTVENKSRTLSGYTYNGMGKAGFHLVQETFSLLLQGDSILYSNYWSATLERTARETKNLYSVRIVSSFPVFADQPISVEIVGADHAPTLRMDEFKIPVLEDISIDGLWHARVWASQPGWHSLTIEEDSTMLKFYVNQQSEWSELASANLINATKSIKTSKARAPEISEIPERFNKAISPLVFYIIFLLSAGYIWTAPKL